MPAPHFVANRLGTKNKQHLGAVASVLLFLQAYEGFNLLFCCGVVLWLELFFGFGPLLAAVGLAVGEGFRAAEFFCLAVAEAGDH